MSFNIEGVECFIFFLKVSIFYCKLRMLIKMSNQV